MRTGRVRSPRSMVRSSTLATSSPAPIIPTIMSVVVRACAGVCSHNCGASIAATWSKSCFICGSSAMAPQRRAGRVIRCIGVLHHFSEDPTIERFRPHVPATNPRQRPAVWAIDAVHAPLYWFPRDCPRVTAWPRDEHERSAFAEAWVTSAPRVHAIETGWFATMRAATIYRYDLPTEPFSPWAEASGQWVSTEEVVPTAVTPL